MEPRQEELVSTFIVDMINNYVKHYLRKDRGGLLEDIDVEDPTATNFHLEDFYRHMENYKIYERINPEFIRLHTEITDELKDRINEDESEWFAILNNREIIFVSQSFFAILIEFTNLKNENDSLNYSILKV